MRKSEFFKKGFPPGLGFIAPSMTGSPASENSTAFSLGNVYPNPFFAVATIPFTLFTDGYVQLVLRDADGRKLHTLLHYQRLTSGAYKVCVDKDALGLAPGTYGYQLTFSAGSGDAKKRGTLVIR